MVKKFGVLMHQFENIILKLQSENSELFKKIKCQSPEQADYTCRTGWNFGEVENIEFIDFHFIETKLQNIQMKKNFQEQNLPDDVLEFKKKT